MASSAPNKAMVARAAAILTTSEVAASTLDLNNCHAGQVAVDLSFTKGSLTNVIAKFYVSNDASTWKAIAIGAAVATETLTADAERCYVFPGLGGWKWFRASLTGTGTVTSSSAAVTYRYLQYGSQG